MKHRRNDIAIVKDGTGIGLLQKKAINIMIQDPKKGFNAVAKETGCSRTALYKWRRDPVFVKAYHREADIYLDSFLPQVDRAMVNKALEGDVSAAKYLSELRGRIQKKVDITITAPFTEWQKLQEPVEEGKVEIVEPEINFETKGERTNRMRNEHNEWKRRADDIGVPQLPSGRPTKEALEEWHEEILLAEANYEG
ncbi:hypothetical protein HN682_01375 [Candidatus Peregrinibacteria bacterium]|jgi:DNA-binding phage protein|nr:hypothetical protein [Candidatus Scalindua sp.]MBT7928556.1 hypothetical protein [Candidatus Peregrinibacteria bacterium]